MIASYISVLLFISKTSFSNSLNSSLFKITMYTVTNFCFANLCGDVADSLNLIKPLGR